MRSILNNNARATIVLISFFLFSSCSKKINEIVKSDTALPFYIECESIQHTPKSGIDSKVGMLTCDNYTFQYDYGRYSSMQPISLFESFTKKFYAYHYSKFFEAIYVEEKLREPLKDSITILEVVNRRFEGKYIVDCTDCMATAKLSFADNVFLYAFNPSPKAIENENDFAIQIDFDENDYYKKTFISNKENIHGVYIAPSGNFNKSRMKNKLVISTEGKISDPLQSILNSIHIK